MDQNFLPQIGQQYLLTSEKYDAQGNGLIQCGKHRILIPGLLPGETAMIAIEKATKHSFIGKIISRSVTHPNRIQPLCQHFSTCGGCTLQHLEETAYHRFKYENLIQQAQAFGFNPEIIEPIQTIPPYSRRRVHWQIHFHQKKYHLGFFAFHSHDLVPIELCHLLTPHLTEMTQSLREKLASLPHDWQLTGLSLQEGENGIEGILHAEVPPPFSALEMLSSLLHLPHKVAKPLIRICWQHKENIHLMGEIQPLFVQFADIKVKLPPYSFLQASTHSEAAIASKIIQALSSAKQVADLYAGCGTYSFRLLTHSKMEAFEGSQAMVDAMKHTISQYSLGGRLQITKRDLFQRPLLPQELQRFDAVIINPPRNGASPQIQMLAKSTVPHIIMVSCNPQTFFRDAALLKKAGFTLKQLTPIDQFLWSAHLEVVGIFQLTSSLSKHVLRK